MVLKIGIDLGTSNSSISVVGKDIFVSEPTVVAISPKDKSVVAIGEEAKKMLGRVPDDIEAKRPIRDGVIASYKLTEIIINHLLNMAIGRIRFIKPEVMVSVPAGITSVEKRAVVEAAVSAGAGKVYLMPEPIAAAIGAKMPIQNSSGNMIINLGGGTSEIAVLSVNGVVTYDSKRVAGDAINESIISTIKKKHNLLIGEQMAEKIKVEIGSALTYENPVTMEVRGRDATTGMPLSLNLNGNDIVDGIRVILNEIIDSVKTVLESTPPELASDIMDRGIVLSGGLSQLKYIDSLFTKAIGVPVHVVDEPTKVVMYGILHALNNLDNYKRSLK